MNVNFKKQGQEVKLPARQKPDFQTDVEVWKAADMLANNPTEGVYLGIVKRTIDYSDGNKQIITNPLIALQTESGSHVRRYLPPHTELIRKLESLRELSAVSIVIGEKGEGDFASYPYEVITVPPDQYDVPKELINESVSLKK